MIINLDGIQHFVVDKLDTGTVETVFDHLMMKLDNTLSLYEPPQNPGVQRSTCFLPESPDSLFSTNFLQTQTQNGQESENNQTQINWSMPPEKRKHV